MTIRIVLAAAVVLLLAACADSSTAPKRLSPNGAAKDEITCRSGYHIAVRSDGSQFCEEDTETFSAEAGDTDPGFTTPAGVTPPAPVTPPVTFPSLP